MLGIHYEFSENLVILQFNGEPTYFTSENLIAIDTEPHLEIIEGSVPKEKVRSLQMMRQRLESMKSKLLVCTIFCEFICMNLEKSQLE